MKNVCINILLQHPDEKLSEYVDTQNLGGGANQNEIFNRQLTERVKELEKALDEQQTENENQAEILNQLEERLSNLEKKQTKPNEKTV